jgi:hypothetical protein
MTALPQSLNSYETKLVTKLGRSLSLGPKLQQNLKIQLKEIN